MSPRSTKIVASGGSAAKGRGAGKGGRGSKGESPMMVQFRQAKKEAGDALVFFRMGDFYELFHEDAVLASRELGLTLTARSKGADSVPMAGVPVKAAEGYLIRLVRKGHKVAICEQLTDPRASKGIVERGIVRLVTPGTLTEEHALDARTPNFLAALYPGKDGVGLAWVELSTGRLQVAELAPTALADELARVRPAELLVAEGALGEHPEWRRTIEEELAITLTERDAWRFDREHAFRELTKHFGVMHLEGFGVEAESSAVPAAGALLEYVAETQRAACEHILGIETVASTDHVVLDRATRSCLELVVTQREGRREGTLLETLDRTETPMGARLLREWVLSPLRRVDPIVRRQQAVAELVASPFLREELRERLESVLDVERLVGKIATGRCNGRDLVALAASLRVVPPMRAKLESVYSAMLDELREALDPLDDLTARIDATMEPEPPNTVREGGLIRAGFHAELDELRQIAGDAKSWMARFQAEESERSSIPGLKIGFNSVFGYFLEVPRGQLDRVPESWVRKQTIKTAERYITPELKEFETKVLNAEERARDLEYELFTALREEVAAEVRRVLETARAIAELDAVTGLAVVAAEQGYVAPTVDEGTRIAFTEGRHPVIERSPACETFVPNDGLLDVESERITILTGPNMAGKSTYIRQTALITLMAQIGSFVPAAEAHVGVVDRIFTRVGAGDDISRGESTFMVEMVEIANILNNATERSLVVLDEVGRGTSTFDGLALAWAIAEHLHERTRCRTLFATHYHQLTDLTQRYAGVVNRNVAVREYGDEIVFLHKIQEGGTDRSYGIHVARLAGVPQAVLDRARSILTDLELEEEDLTERILGHDEAPPARDSSDAGEADRAPAAAAPQQLGLFSAAPSAVERRIEALELDTLTPIDALVLLRELQATLRRG